MTFELSTVLAVGLPVIGAAITWGGANARLRALEKRCAELQGLEKQLSKVEQQLADARGDQGRRIGIVEDLIAMLRGRFEGFERGFATGRRSRTAAHGVPVGGGAGEE